MDVLDEYGVFTLLCDCSCLNERLCFDDNLGSVPAVTDSDESGP